MSVIFSDIDGTLYPFGGKLTKTTKEKILSLAALNVDFVLNTGNSHFPKFIALGKELKSKYIILGCGAGIYDLEQNHYIQTNLISQADGFKMKEVALKHGCDLYYFGLDKHYLYNATPEFEKFIFNHTGITDFDSSGDIPEKLLKMEIHNDDPNIVKACFDEIESLNLNIHNMYMNGTHMEIVKKGTSKGHAMEWMCENIFNVKPDHVMAIGDSANDIDMFYSAGHSYAMDNAPANVKEKASHYTCDASQEGLTMAIIDYLHRMRIEI